MNAGRQTAATRRLTLALDAGRCCPDDVSVAVELAAFIGAEIEGLFVEDSDLMDLVHLPFVREVGARSGLSRPIEREAIESLVRRRVARAIGELERAGRQRNVPVSHTTARGKVLTQALARAEERDVLLFNPRAGTSMVRGHTEAGKVMLWYERDVDAAASFDVAIELARRLRTELLVGFDPGRFVTERDVRAGLASRIAHASGRVRMRPIAAAGTDDLIAALRGSRVTQFVLDAKGRLATEAILERMLNAVASRVILVR